jgi:hypothetical protein
VKVWGSAHGDEVELKLTAMPFCVPAETESAAKQTGNELHMVEKHRTEAAV